MLYQRLSWGAVALHLVQAIIVCGLTIWLDTQQPKGLRKGVFPLYKPVHIWKIGLNDSNSPIAPNIRVDLVMEQAGSLDVRWAIVAFFAMSAAFPAAVLWLNVSSSYRFLEYSISASTMLMAIAVEAGVDDIYTLQCMFVLTFATMILGLIAEFAPQPLSWTAHATAWITFLSAYSPILDAFMQSNNRSSASAPGFVNVVVFFEFILFACFGITQAYELFIQKDEASTQAEHQELLDYNTPMPEEAVTNDKQWIDLAYVSLSLTAKTILAWLILAPIVF